MAILLAVGMWAEESPLEEEHHHGKIMGALAPPVRLAAIHAILTR